MHMSFWWGYDFGDLLFQGLKVNTVGSLVITCIIFAILSVIFEGLKVLETKSRRDHNTRMRQAMLGPCSEDRSNLLGNTSTAASPSCDGQVIPGTPSILKTRCAVVSRQVFLYTTNTSLNYFIMLAIMLYNAYLAITLIIGSTIGYYIFGHIASRYIMQSIKEKAKVATVCVPECNDTGEGSTPPLMKGRGASENNLYSCESQNKCLSKTKDQSENLDDAERVALMPDTEQLCCGANTVMVKKTSDPNKIKSSKNVKPAAAEIALNDKSDCCSSESKLKDNLDEISGASCCKKDTHSTGVQSLSDTNEIIIDDSKVATRIKKNSVQRTPEIM